jgi:hypothetical protein
VRGASIFIANLRCRDRSLPRDPESAMLHECLSKTSIHCFSHFWRGAVTMFVSEGRRMAREVRFNHFEGL